MGAGTPEPADALSAVVARLRNELDGLRRAMRNRAVIEQAKGVLVERMGIAPDTAFDQLVSLSQRTNVKLVELAATLVGTNVPAPTDPRSADHAPPPLHPRRPTARTGSERLSPDVAALQAQQQLLSARISVAESYDQIAETLAEATTGWPQPAVAMIALLEADGALRLAGATGMSAEARSQWIRTPPMSELPIVAAAHTQAPIFLPDPQSIATQFPLMAALPYPSEAVAALALQAGGKVIGVLGLTWDAVRRYLHAVAESCARRCAELAQSDVTPEPDPTGHEPQPDRAWLPLVLETVHEPVVLLTPTYDGDRVTDFHTTYANSAARRTAQVERLTVDDASLLTVLPDAGSRVLLAAFAEVLHTGEPCHLPEVTIIGSREGIGESYLLGVHASRLWDQVLASWHPVSDADLLHEQLLQAERLCRTGSFWYDVRLGATRWSPQMYVITGRRPEEGPVRSDQLHRYVHPDDLRTVQDRIAETLPAGRDLAVEVRGGGPVAGRQLRVIAEPLRDDDGAVWAVRGTCQDITEERAVRTQLRQAEQALAAQRRRAEVEQRAVDALQAALTSPSLEVAVTEDITVRGARRTVERVGGHWYDVFTLPDGATMLVVGEVAGAGAQAAVTAGRLRHAAPAYAVLGMAPGELLGALNTLLCRFAPDHVATMVVALYRPDQHELNWAAAGQVAPMCYRADGSVSVL